MSFCEIFLYSCRIETYSCDSNQHTAGISAHLTFFVVKVLNSAYVAKKCVYVSKLADFLPKHPVLISARVGNECIYSPRDSSSVHAAKNG